ncbi:MspA family porin [Mycobacterium sp. URHD0025]|uniref:MspA family porin n=1 Tax=Mycobacterium sp. URHD0025 TaxID=1298864 RepID=UPI00048E2848|nr:MspA family porin [Mycobacterium sp. URHD0025]
MAKPLAALVLIGFLTATATAWTAPHATADPDITPVEAEVAPPAPPPEGAVPSAEASTFTSPEGWQLTASSKNETLLPVQPLTSALTAREYLVGGTFVGVVSGSGSTTLTGGSFEVGYRIGCGIALDTVDLAGSLGITPSMKIPGFSGDSNYPNIGGLVRVHLKPGAVTAVQVDKKSFKGRQARVNVAGFRIKTDGCAGQSFIQSYATLSSSTADTEDVTTYLGTVKVF